MFSLRNTVKRANIYASISGLWTGTVTTLKVTNAISVTLAADGPSLKGTASINGRELELGDEHIEGQTISFTLSTGLDDMPEIEFRGSVEGDRPAGLRVAGTASFYEG
jgi:hypothetical protein